jgi:hypothetical protein
MVGGSVGCWLLVCLIHASNVRQSTTFVDAVIETEPDLEDLPPVTTSIQSSRGSCNKEQKPNAKPQDICRYVGGSPSSPLKRDQDASPPPPHHHHHHSRVILKLGLQPEFLPCLGARVLDRAGRVLCGMPPLTRLLSRRPRRKGVFFPRGGRGCSRWFTLLLHDREIYFVVPSRFKVLLTLSVRYGTNYLLNGWLALGRFPREKLLEYGMPNTANEYKTVTCASPARRLVRACLGRPETTTRFEGFF